MIETAIAQGLFKLSLAVLGIIIGWLVLRLLDHFSNMDERINRYDTAPNYYGLRILAVMLAIGLILG